MSRAGRGTPNVAVLVRTPAGVATAASQGDATATGTGTASSAGTLTRGPIVVNSPSAAYLRALVYDTVTIIVPPAQDTGTASGDAVGAATATGTGTASATTPNAAPNRPIVVSDAARAVRARWFADPATIVAPPAVDAPPGTADAAGAVTAMGTGTAGAVSPGGRPAPLIVQGDQAAAYRARLAPDPLVLLAPPVQDAPAGGPTTAVPAPLVFSDRGAGYRLRAGQYETTYVVSGQADPANVAGSATGAVTATGTGAALATPSANATGTVVATGTGTGQTGSLASALGATVATGSGTAHASVFGAATGQAVATGTATASQSGGNFHPVVHLSVFTRRVVRIVARTRRWRGGRNG